jgi:NADH-quinone oxidoreductase subunit I
MQLTNKAKLVDRRPLSIAEKIYLPAILKEWESRFRIFLKRR